MILRARRSDKTGAKVLFKPPVPGEYTVVVTSPAKDKDGKPILTKEPKVIGQPGPTGQGPATIGVSLTIR